MTKNVFAVPVFLIVFRETLETSIIVSVLLAFLKQTFDGPDRNANAVVYNTLVKQVWIGVAAGIIASLAIAAGIIGTFYTVGHDAWQGHEYDYEGAFALIASVIISFVGATLLRVGKAQDKWRAKIAARVVLPTTTTTTTTPGWWLRLRHLTGKYAMVVLPFITVLREGVEAVVFVAGVSFSAPATAVPLPVVVGLIVGCLVGYALYRGGTTTRLQYFLVASTCLLYLVGAGLFSRAIWFFEAQRWNNLVGGDAAEVGTGPGSYDIDKSVWHVNCCSPELDGGAGGWGIFNGILGWTNSATYGSVISYNLYWIAVMVSLVIMRHHEVKGHWPLFGDTKADSRSASSVTAELDVVAGGTAQVTKLESSQSVTPA